MAASSSDQVSVQVNSNLFDSFECPIDRAATVGCLVKEISRRSGLKDLFLRTGTPVLTQPSTKATLQESGIVDQPIVHMSKRNRVSNVHVQAYRVTKGIHKTVKKNHGEVEERQGG